MSLTFYFAPMSTATITQLVLAELGTPHEAIKVDLQKGENKKPDFLARNPNATVPTIVHDGTAIWESAAITMYLGEQFGVDKKLYPAPGPRRGEAMKWIVWTNVSLGNAVAHWTRNTMEWIPADQHNAKAADAGMKEISRYLKILDEALEGRDFLIGDYTLADTHVNAFCDWLRMMKKIDFTPYARLNQWSERCGARPAHVKVMGAAAE
jgi:glutathione S-transferase